MATDLTTAPRGARPRVRAGCRDPDRLTLALFSLAAFMAVLALLATELRQAPVRRAAPTVLLRKVYRTTTVIETRIGAGPTPAPSVSQSVSSSGGSAPAPVTRSS